MNDTKKHRFMTWVVVAASCLASPRVHADVVTDWSSTACEIAVAGKLPAGGAYRAMAAVQEAVYDAANAVTKQYPTAEARLQAPSGASLDAAVAAANRAMLTALVPSQKEAIDKAYQAALGKVADGPAKTDGIAVGEQAAKAVLEMCAGDGYDKPESYRPNTTPGAYVTTILPDLAQWPGRKPWLLDRADQFRPGPPPSLTSAVWARDYNEIKALGGRQSTQRTAEQTAIARFWEARVPNVYLPVVLSVATTPGREPTRNARLLAVATQAMDDTLIAVTDAKFHYNFWRPITAIRNGDRDDNDATERDASWVPFIDTPMHPEYPCAHCALSGAVATVLEAEIGGGTMPTLRATSPTAPGMERSWTTFEAFKQEVANARIYDGVHFRNSTEVGTAMGKKIGELAAAKSLRPPN
jgi:hypothetical protein